MENIPILLIILESLCPLLAIDFHRISHASNGIDRKAGCPMKLCFFVLMRLTFHLKIVLLNYHLHLLITYGAPLPMSLFSTERKTFQA